MKEHPSLVVVDVNKRTEYGKEWMEIVFLNKETKIELYEKNRYQSLLKQAFIYHNNKIREHTEKGREITKKINGA